jgi:tetratricopeptide (TPR) repeat protein
MLRIPSVEIEYLMSFDIFVSYSTRSTFAEQQLIYDAHVLLEARYGLERTFVAKSSIPASEEWRPKLLAALGQCQAGVIVLTAAALGLRTDDFSDWVLTESTVLKYRRDIERDFKLLVVALPGADLERLKAPPWGPLALESLQLETMPAGTAAADLATFVGDNLGQLRSKSSRHDNLSYSAQAERLYKFGSQQLHGKNFESAIHHFTQALKLDPNGFAALLDRGLAFCAVGQFEQALTDLSKALELQPGNPFARFNRGMVHLHRSDLTAACGDWREVDRAGFNIAEPWIKRYCGCSS